MDESLGSFKTLEEVHLKATQNIELDGKTFEPGETIAYFDKIQIAGLSELKNYISAHGGYGDRDWVFWETTKRLNLTFSQGVFSNLQFGLLNNVNLIHYEEEEPLLVTKVEELETDEFGNVTTSFYPIDQIFVYSKATGEKKEWWRVGDQLNIGREQSFVDLVVKYRYNYGGGATVAKIGQRCLCGFLEFEGKTRVKDDTSGLITTGIIKIPKLKLMSGLSIRLGAQANPVVGTFEAIGVPVEERHSSYVAEFCFLKNDIDSDM